ncbi:hypothetical protein GIB67_009212, partial [Kingdonia uniflora]
KRKTIDPSTVVPPNTVDSANEGVSEGVNIPTESVEGVNIPQGSEFEIGSAQAGLGAQPPLPNVWPNFVENIPILGGYSEGEGVTSNDDVGPSDKNLLRSFRFHRARSIALGKEKLPIRVHHHQSMWDLRKEPQVDLNAFNSLKAEGTGILLTLKKLKSHYAYKLEKVLSDGTTATAKKKKGLTARFVARANMLYVLGSFLFPAKKGTDVSARYLVLFAKDKVAKKLSWGSAVLAHMYYNLGAASRDDARQFSWIFTHFPKLGGIPKEMDSDAYKHYDSGINQRKPTSVNEHGDTPVHQSEDIAEQYDASLQKLKEDKEKEFEANINLREALKEKTSECNLLRQTIEQIKEEIELKRVVDEQCALKFVDHPRQLDSKILECKNLEEKNISLEAELRSKSGLDDCNQSLSFELNKKCKEIESLKAVNTILIEQIDMQLLPATPSHQPVPDTTLAKKYEDLLAAHEDIKKKLIAKEDFIKAVNAEERMKSLEVNNCEWHKKLVNSGEIKKTLEVDNNEWEVWRQTLKKTLASEGMGDMGDPIFEELFEQNERFFTISQ